MYCLLYAAQSFTSFNLGLVGHSSVRNAVRGGWGIELCGGIFYEDVITVTRVCVGVRYPEKSVT